MAPNGYEPGTPMTTPHSKALNELVEKAKDKIAIAELHERLTGLIEGERTKEELTDWRLQRGVLKKVCDEMFPVSRFFTHTGNTDGMLSFPQDSKVPDAWWYRTAGLIGIEVTISQGRARYILGTELIATKGVTRGFLGLQDDAKPKVVAAAKEQERAMYVTEQALTTTENGIRRCLEQKNDVEYKGMILLIEAPLSTLPTERWDAMVPSLKEAAKDMPFSEIHVLGKGDKLMRLQIK